MKNYIWILASFMATGAQEADAQNYFSAATDYSHLYVGRIEPQYQLALWKDSPYYKDDQKMMKGRVSYCHIVYDDVLLRYDQFMQNLAVCTPEVNAYCLPVQKDIDWFELDGHKYVRDPEDSTKWAAILCDGSTNGIRLYHSVWKSYESDELVDSKYLKTLSNHERYTMLMPDGTMHHVKDASDVAKLFPEQKKDIKSFSKHNGLSYRQSMREKSLAKLTGSIIGTPLPEPAPYMESKPEQLQATVKSKSFDVKPSLIPGIPVLDSKDVATVDSRNKQKTFIIPGVKKAKVSIADDHDLGEIVVVAGRQSTVKSTTMGTEKFKPDLLKNIPTVFGETDIMKIVLTLPGVTTVGEASSGFNVRGGATDQNLILFNGGTVYNPSHLFGLFTSFNAEMVEDVELFKSSIPAEYGGRISSVMKVTAREANMKKFKGSASIGMLTSKACLEIPVVKNHLSLLVNGRTTYSDWLLKEIPKKSGYQNGTANFYDFGGVLTWKLNDRHRLKLFGYVSNDRFAFSEDNKYGYQNCNFSAEWRSIFSEKFVAVLTGGLDHYDYLNDDTTLPFSAARLSFAIDEWWAKLHFRHNLSDKTKMNYGLMTLNYDVQGGDYKPLGQQSTIAHDRLDNEKARESSAYMEVEHSFSKKFSVSAGVRYTLFESLGPRKVNNYEPNELPSENTLIKTEEVSGTVKKYQAPEFRFSTRYSIRDNLSIKAGFNTMHQYIHKVSNTAVMSPTDIWKLSDTNIKPQEGWQIAAGIYKETKDKQYELSAEVYYKHINDYLNYRNSAVLLMNHHLETDVIPTKGKAYGVELQVKKPYGKLNGWLSYTWSRSLLRQVDSRVENPLNDGNWYPNEYDRPHEVKAVVNYKFTERYSISSNFNYATGRPTTVPAGRYYDGLSTTYKPFFSDRNGYRIPDYTRLDLAFNIEPTHKLTSLLHTSFSIGVYNVLARRNAYNVYYVTEKNRIQGYKISVFGTAIPYISMNIKIN